MTFELTLSTFYTLLCIAAMFVGCLWTMALFIIRIINASLNKKFVALQDHMEKQDEAMSKQDIAIGKQREDFAEFRLEVTKDYVRRDDFNRVIGTFQVTVDNLRLELRQWFLGKQSS